MNQATTRISTDRLRGMVLVEFSRSVDNLTLPPAQARAIAASLLKHADSLDAGNALLSKEVIS